MVRDLSVPWPELMTTFEAAARSNVTFVIREADLPAALGRLHQKFFAPVPAPAGLA